MGREADVYFKLRCYRSGLMACVMLSSLAAMSSCTASGKGQPSQTPSDTRSQVSPAAGQETPDHAMKAICESQKVDVSVNRCGEYYSTYPTGFIVDAATEIFDKNGKHIDSCGGNRAFASDQAREESEKKCAAYLLDCKQVLESCRSLR
jgi:hypothetical protein